MAKESTAIAGSGVSALREGLTPNSKGPVPGLHGTNSVVVNYEDINSCLGIAQSTAATINATGSIMLAKENRLHGRRKIIIDNGSGMIFIGGSDVTVANGLRLAASEKLALDVLDVGDLYAMTASGTSDVRILELK